MNWQSCSFVSVLDYHQLKMHCLNLILIPTLGKMIELQSVKFLCQHRFSEFYCTGQEVVGDMGRETFFCSIIILTLSTPERLLSHNNTSWVRASWLKITLY